MRSKYSIELSRKSKSPCGAVSFTSAMVKTSTRIQARIYSA